MRYAISNVKNVLVPNDANTTASTYPVLEYKGFKKLPTRALAREYKRTRRYAQRYVIVDTQRQMIVR
jgi:hypothetical protein